MRYAAIDFETANYDADSACAVGLVVVENGRIVDRATHLIRPPSRNFTFTHIHGITWNDVREAQTFAGVWSDLRERLQGSQFLAAHNAPFDRGVLSACCNTWRIFDEPPPFVCSVQVARRTWRIFPTKLPNVCAHLGIDLAHHQADSDAEACARIMMAAIEAGWRPSGSAPG